MTTAFPSFAGVHAVRIPTTPPTVDLKDYLPLFQKRLWRILENVRTGSQPNDVTKIRSMTASEAREAFAPYISQQLQPEENEAELLAKVFTHVYFGDLPTPPPPQSPESIATEDPYLFSAIYNAIVSGDGSLPETERERFGPGIYFLTAREVLEAYINRGGDLGKELESMGLFDQSIASYLRRLFMSSQQKKRLGNARKVFSAQNFPGPPPEGDEEARRRYFLSTELFPPRAVVDSLFASAMKILRITKPGDVLVVFGNTPYFIGHALQSVISQIPSEPNYRRIIYFPFSGSPNRTRIGSVWNEQDIVTPQRYAHLLGRLRQAGLIGNPELRGHSILFIDVIGSAGGVAFVAEAIIRDHRSASTSDPDLQVITLNKIDIADRDDPRNGLIAKSNADEAGRLRLHLPSVSSPHFTIDAHEVYTPGHWLLDMHDPSPLRIVPACNPSFWLHEYDHLFTGQTSQFMAYMLEYVKAHMQEQLRRERGQSRRALLLTLGAAAIGALNFLPNPLTLGATILALAAPLAMMGSTTSRAMPYQQFAASHPELFSPEGDGTCFWVALSYALYGSGLHYTPGELFDMAKNFIQDHPEMFEGHFVGPDQAQQLAQYLNDLQMGVWADNFMVGAIVHALQEAGNNVGINITTYNLQGTQTAQLPFFPGEANTANTIVNIQNFGNLHFLAQHLDHPIHHDDAVEYLAQNAPLPTSVPAGVRSSRFLQLPGLGAMSSLAARP